jgi:hypothetical protein
MSCGRFLHPQPHQPLVGNRDTRPGDAEHRLPDHEVDVGGVNLAVLDRHQRPLGNLCAPAVVVGLVAHLGIAHADHALTSSCRRRPRSDTRPFCPQPGVRLLKDTSWLRAPVVGASLFHATDGRLDGGRQAPKRTICATNPSGLDEKTVSKAQARRSAAGSREIRRKPTTKAVAEDKEPTPEPGMSR